MVTFLTGVGWSESHRAALGPVLFVMRRIRKVKTSILKSCYIRRGNASPCPLKLFTYSISTVPRVSVKSPTRDLLILSDNTKVQ